MKRVADELAAAEVKPKLLGSVPLRFDPAISTPHHIVSSYICLSSINIQYPISQFLDLLSLNDIEDDIIIYDKMFHIFAFHQSQSEYLYSSRSLSLKTPSFLQA